MFEWTVYWEFNGQRNQTFWVNHINIVVIHFCNFCFLSWSDISNVINHKRDFIIETVINSEKVQFQFGDVESAKNAWRFCVLQHVFFRQYEMNNGNEKTDKSSMPLPIFQQNEVNDRSLFICKDVLLLNI